MNEFERALQKDQKRRESLARSAERKTLHLPKQEPKQEPINGHEHDRMLPGTKEKPHTNGFVHVSVEFPGLELSLTFVKDNVLQNVPRSKMNKDSFANALMEGLRPIMGSVVMK